MEKTFFVVFSLSLTPLYASSDKPHWFIPPGPVGPLIVIYTSKILICLEAGRARIGLRADSSTAAGCAPE